MLDFDICGWWLPAFRRRNGTDPVTTLLSLLAPIDCGNQKEIQPAAPLEANLAGFYNLAHSLDDFPLSFKAPAIEMAVLKRLGDPNFLGQESLLATLEPVYAAVRASALEAALGEAKEEETPE